MFPNNQMQSRLVPRQIDFRRSVPPCNGCSNGIRCGQLWSACVQMCAVGTFRLVSSGRQTRTSTLSGVGAGTAPNKVLHSYHRGRVFLVSWTHSRFNPPSLCWPPASGEDQRWICLAIRTQQMPEFPPSCFRRQKPALLPPVMPPALSQ